MIEVHVPTDRAVERAWVIGELLGRRCGFPHRVVPVPGARETSMIAAGRMIVFPDIFFPDNALGWGHRFTFPSSTTSLGARGVPLKALGEYRDLPVLFGDGKCSYDETLLRIGVDVIGSCFAELSRYEEWCSRNRDVHGRFEASASRAAQHGYLSRPIVDEYASLVATAISIVWPAIRPRRVTSHLEVSSDIDHPLESGTASVPMMAKAVARRLVGRSGAAPVMETLSSYLRNRSDGWRLDKNAVATIWLARELAARDMVGRFFFIPSRSHALDGEADLSDARVSALAGDVRSMGHRLGLHPGYSSFDSEIQMRRSLTGKAARTVCPDDSGESHVRQHFLRWDVRSTQRAYESWNVDVDHSVGYAHLPGFRAGTAWRFRPFDVERVRAFRHEVQPLVTMDVTLRDSKYLGVGSAEKRIAIACDLAGRVRRSGGTFTLLWHNTMATATEQREEFGSLVDQLRVVLGC